MKNRSTKVKPLSAVEYYGSELVILATSGSSGMEKSNEVQSSDSRTDSDKREKRTAERNIDPRDK